MKVTIDMKVDVDDEQFDYVAMTSINPLRIYVYEDGLVRFAT